MNLNYPVVSRPEYAAYLTRKAALGLVGTLLLAGGLSAGALLIVLLILTPAGVPSYTMSAAAIGLIAGTAVTAGLGLHRRAAWMPPVRPVTALAGPALNAARATSAALKTPARSMEASRVGEQAGTETGSAVLREGVGGNDQDL